MNILSKDRKLLTLSLLLRTMSKEQRSLLMAHFNPEVTKLLNQIEEETAPDVEKMDWTPFYESWPELQKIVNECKGEIKTQKLFKMAEDQRPKIKEYISVKLGKQKKGPPIFLSKEVMKILDQSLQEIQKI